MRVYMDNAATTPLCEKVLETMLPFLRNNFGNPSSTHQEGRTARAAIEKTRKIVSKAIGAINSEIIFTSGGTEANNTAIKCAVRDLGVTRIISSPIEHSCVYNAVGSFAECPNTSIEFVKLDQYGRADMTHLEELLAGSDQKTLVTLMHANNEIGTVNPIKEIGDLCAKYEAYFHTDTVQTIGHLPIDVSKMNVHFLSGSGHKLHGPKGVGFLYINKENTIGAYIDGGGQERKMRSGTENVASIIGLGKALQLAVDELDERRQHIESVRQYFIEQLEANFSDIRMNGDYNGDYLFTVLSVAFKTATPANILLFKLDMNGISASGGSACNSGAVSKSRVLSHFDIPDAYQSARFSFSHHNTKADVDYTIQCLKKII